MSTRLMNRWRAFRRPAACRTSANGFASINLRRKSSHGKMTVPPASVCAQSLGQPQPPFRRRATRRMSQFKIVRVVPGRIERISRVSPKKSTKSASRVGEPSCRRHLDRETVQVLLEEPANTNRSDDESASSEKQTRSHRLLSSIAGSRAANQAGGVDSSGRLRSTSFRQAIVRCDFTPSAPGCRRSCRP